jgi:hypothetical protein
MATSVGGGGSSVSLATRTVDVHAHVRDEDSPERVLAANETLRERQQIGVTDYGPPSPRKRRLSKEPPSSTDVHAHARGEDSPEKELAANETLREQQQSGVTDFGPPSPRKKMSSRAPMSSPRVQRLEVREQKKASVKCASTLDFTALSVKRSPHTRAPAHDHRSTAADDVLEPRRRVIGRCFATAKMAASPSEHMAGTAKMIARPREHMARRAWPWLIGQQSRRESARS